MKILVTGGNGFIAKNLAEQLNGEHSVISLNRIDLDLLDPDKVFEYINNNKFDIIIHTATYDAAPKHSKKDPAKVLENNLKMFFNLVRCKDNFGKMLYFGSGAEFDRNHWMPKMKEEYFDKHVPSDQYGFSKYIMNKYANSSDNVYNLRLFGVFGKYDDWQTRFIPNAICRAVSDLPIEMIQDRSFDFICIDDLVKIVKWFINNQPRYHAYNICTGRTVDFKTIAELIIKISGKEIKILTKIEGQGLEYSGENSLFLNEIKSFKFASIDSSIKKLYEWHESNKNIIEKSKL